LTTRKESPKPSGNSKAESIHKRFFQYKKALSEEELKAATEVDFENVVALMVTTGEEGAETIIGAGRYVAFDTADAQRSAEVAFMVGKTTRVSASQASPSDTSPGLRRPKDRRV